MIVEELRKSILNYAIAGLLSKQNQKEKCNICNINSIDDSNLFAIPHNWKWLKVKDIGDLIRGNGIKRNETIDSGVQCIRYGEIYTNYSYSFNKTISYVSEDLANNCKNVMNGDILLTLTGENEYDIAKATAYLGNERLVAGGDMAILTNHQQNPLYLSYFFASPFAIKQKSKTAKGNIIVHTSTDKIGDYFIPIPPIEEQERIVKKIEELFIMLDETKPIEDELLNLKNTFPKDLKNSLYQAAMTGELSIQNDYESARDFLNKLEIVQEETGFVKMKNITPVLESTIPYKIPDNWIWKKIGDLVEINLGFTYRPTYVDKGYMFLSVKDISSGYIDFENVKYISKEEYDKASYGSKPQKGDILFGRVGTIGVPQIVETDDPFCIFVSLGFFRDYTNMLNKKFICYWMCSSLFKKQVADNVTGTAQINLNSNWLKNFYIPIPPIEEQERIVDKLERLLPLCNEVESLITGE